MIRLVVEIINTIRFFVGLGLLKVAMATLPEGVKNDVRNIVMRRVH